MNKSDRRKEGWQYILANLKDRRAIFPPAFTDEMVPRADIEKILEAANWAPTHKLTQPWRFVVMRGESRKALATSLLAYYDQHTPSGQKLEKKRKKILANPLKASAIIAICLHVDQQNAIPEWEELAATACAVQNLWLAASALGIGGYWSSPAAASDLGAFLNLKDNERCLGLFYLGFYHPSKSEPNRSPWQEKVKWME
ncbi:MAG: nitroreductase [Saprospiraceae bacterium]|nr:nitroreductase [Saprospiraceae bacterium]